MKAAIYIRVSTLDQAREGYSLAAQERTLTKYCESKEYQIYDTYADKGISAKDLKHRPDVLRMLRDADDEKFDTICIWALSRFTRSVSDLYITCERLAKHNIGIESYTEAFDTSTAMGRAMIGVMGVFAQLERELTAERVIAGMTERARQGLPTCCYVLGYDRDGKTLTVNAKEAEMVKYIYHKYLQYKNILAVSEICCLKGFRGKKGGLLKPESIHKILTRPIYCGYNSFLGNIYPGNHEPIIDTLTFNQVQREIEKRSSMSGRTRKTRLRYL